MAGELSRSHLIFSLAVTTLLTLIFLQKMVDSDPKLQCQSTRNADVFGWETGSKGVWVLENPTQEQFDKLAAFPPSTDQNVVNGHLAAVGAVHYDDWSDHDGALYLMNNFQGTASLLKTMNTLLT